MSKILSLFLTILIVSLTVPMAFAATETLSTSNVQSWPTLSYNNDGKMYYGQTLGEGITINDDEVVVDAAGNQVSGHFIFIDSTVIPDVTESSKSHLEFVPDDTNAYSGFQKKRSSVTYSVQQTTLVLADETKPPIVAAPVKQNTKFSDIIISDGQVKNPYNPTEQNALTAYWEWLNPTQTITESGYFDAQLITTSSYTPFVQTIYVEVEQEKQVTEIEKFPTVDSFTYNSNKTWSSVDLEGGLVVVKGTDTEVEGTFTINPSWLNTVPSAGNYNVEVTFTPLDTEKYLSIDFTVPTTVNKLPLSFKDTDGNAVADEFIFEVEPNEKMSNIQSLIWDALIAPEGSMLKVEDYYGYAVNGKTYKLTVQHENQNYEGANEVNELYFTVKFKETELDSVRFFQIGEGKWKVDCGTYSLPGVFTVYAILGETETKIGEVKSNQTLEWMPSSSGDYTFRVEYTPAEEDYFIVNKVTTYSLKHQPNRYFTATGSETTPFLMGETVKVVAPATDPAMAEEPYYGFVGWTVVSGNPDISEEQLANAELSFAMPDENVELKANYKFSHELYFKWIWQQIVEAFQFVISAFKELFGLAFVV